MIFNQLLMARKEQNRPIRVGIIGAGKFGSMFLAQARLTPGIHVVGIADTNIERVKNNLDSSGWPLEQYTSISAARALKSGTTFITDDAEKLIDAGGVEIIVEATGVPEMGILHALQAINRGRHVIMVNVEADALAGPLLAKRAREARVVYSLAYGDQPALICEQVDWVRACGLTVVAAGKGTKYLPEYHSSTPDTVWNYYGLTAERANSSGMNAKMFNSFLDGTKSAIEMASVSNATGLTPAPSGLTFPACDINEIASIMIPEKDGGALHHKGQVEVISSQKRDGSTIQNNLRWGVFVTFEAPTDYVERCFADYGLLTDPSGHYSGLWRPYHLIGLELGLSIAWAAINQQPTGTPNAFRADVTATAKRDLKPGEILDGEGGHCVWGRLMSADEAHTLRALPIGLAQGIKIKRMIKKGAIVTWADVEKSSELSASLGYRIRCEMEAEFLNRTKSVPNRS
ncbi:MAG: flagellar biosynthesis protein FlgA [Rhodospirillaceae bacterium TMED8]|nr:flagellar biosynthesis protein FlgA [Magnetovibrio sp.]OUT48600.1 MAG: flagellar biosynthesis protein FlgA [Rhodospirillaceae bacterium TMED8]|tara:strand:- start:739 stop:2115 length:1377 start_codon:yes stop_codon:yes gene_type:complete